MTSVSRLENNKHRKDSESKHEVAQEAFAESLWIRSAIAAKGDDPAVIIVAFPVSSRADDVCCHDLEGVLLCSVVWMDDI